MSLFLNPKGSSGTCIIRESSRVGGVIQQQCPPLILFANGNIEGIVIFFIPRD